jgi:hypothetical protein
MRGRLLLAAGLLAGAALFTSGCSTAAGYVEAAKDTISADNYRDQWGFVTKYWESLTVTAQNACRAEGSTVDEAGPTMVEGAGFAYQATYLKVWSKYNARQKDIFEAGFVGPPGYPKEVPDYTSDPDASFCDISAQLAVIKAEAE